MNIKRNEPPLEWDAHTHCLPNMDDGSDSKELSVRMLQALAGQGIRHTVLTSHFYPQHEKAPDFLKRRSQSYAVLKDAAQPVSGLPRLLTGAEIYLTRGLSEIDLRPLCMEGTRFLLLELPRQDYKPWMLEEIQNITYALDIIPVLAHIERYLMWYQPQNFRELLSFDELILQCNIGSLLDRSRRRFLTELAEGGYPLIAGSDCHNLTERPPLFSEVRETLLRKRAGKELMSYLRRGEDLLQGRG